jgi:hypothetical protein
VGEVFDIELVKNNALIQGIALQQIVILYVGLDETERQTLAALKLLKFETETALAATFTEDGEALFPSKITSAYYLGAD